jgi:hypothetical protein
MASVTPEQLADMVAERVAAHLDYGRLADAIVQRQAPAELVSASVIAKRIGKTA